MATRIAYSFSIFVTCFFLATSAKADILVDPGPSGQLEPSLHFSVKFDGQESFVYQTFKRPEESGPVKGIRLDTMSWTTVTADKVVPVEVKFLKRNIIKNAIIRPKSLGIKAKVYNNIIRFNLPVGKRITIEEQDDIRNPLFIFAFPEEPKPENNEIPNLVTFGPGIHRLQADPMPINDNQTIWLQPGAYVYGRFHTEHASNARIIGRGTICGTYLERPGYGWSGKFREKGKLRLISLHGANCELWGPTVVDGPWWSMRFSGADPNSLNRVHHAQVLGWYVNSDGFQDMTHTRANDLFTCVNDDPFILNNIGNCELNGAVVWGMRAGAPLRLGWNGKIDTGHIVYRNIDVVHFMGQEVISLWHGGPSHVKDILIDNLRLEGPMSQLIKLRIADNPWAPKDKPLGRASDITIQNITAEGPFFRESLILGDSSDHTIERVTIRNLSIGGKKIQSLEEIPLKTNEFTKDIRLE